MTPRSVCAIVGIIVAATGACGSGDGEDDGFTGAGAASPEQAVTAVLTGMEAGDCAKVRAAVVTPDAIDCEVISGLRGSYADDGVDLDDITLSSGVPAGGSTTVTVEPGDGAEAQTWQVEKIGGTWKVLFDSEV